MSYPSHHNPLWYNFLTIIWGWTPWTLVLLISLFGLKWNEMHLLPAGNSFTGRIRKVWDNIRSQSPIQLFIWIVIIAIFVFYCIPKSKRSVYLLPIYPFMAVLIAQYLEALMQKGAKVFKISAYIFASLCLLLTAVFFAVRCQMIPDSIWGNGRHAAENIAFMQALESTSFSISKWLIIVLPVVAAICTLRLVIKKSSTGSLLYGITGCVLCLFVALDGVYQPTILAVKSDKHLAEDIRKQVPEGVVYSYTDRMIRFYCTNYYMNNQMRNFTLENPQEGYVILSANAQEEFLKNYNAKYQLEEVFHTDYRSCDLRNTVIMYKFNEKRK